MQYLRTGTRLAAGTPDSVARSIAEAAAPVGTSSGGAASSSEDDDILTVGRCEGGGGGGAKVRPHLHDATTSAPTAQVYRQQVLSLGCYFQVLTIASFTMHSTSKCC